ncbi:MAG: discoidin domain-containing protein [Vicinamibacteria bacterium]|nr:discoidin domain-containing protein [Vicinamibacteria bacterium]
MKRSLLIVALLVLLAVSGFVSTCFASPADRIALDGEWRFAIDRRDEGEKERWCEKALANRIHLPGSLQSQGYGDDVTATTEWVGALHDTLWFLRSEYRKHTRAGQVRTPFLLQPEKHYVGAAWYQRAIDIPAAWRGRRIVLTLERPHWQTRAWLDDRPLGTRGSLGTPHIYDLGVATIGRHTLTIRVDNRMVVEVGANAHSVTDYTQSDWNGIVGDIALHSTSLVWLEDVQAFPNVTERSVRLKLRIGNATGRRGTGRLTVGDRIEPVAWNEEGAALDLGVTLGEQAKLWDEFNPSLTRLRVHLAGDQADDEREIVFGLREIGVAGTQFTLNGRKVYLRGTHEGCSFPLTGYPPTDVASWKRIIRIARAHGLNHMRFHSWCPPEAAFTAADELGFYLQPECSIWARDGARLDPGNRLEAWLFEESARMMKHYGNHPSFLLLTHGNEPEGRWVEALSRWVSEWSARDPRRLYGACTGGPMKHELGPVTGTQFYVIIRIGQNRVRGTGDWDGKDYRLVVENTNVPIVSHELGQHCVYPNFAEIGKYTGFLKPKNYEIFRDSLAEHGLLSRAHDFLTASGKLQVLAYKEDIEACLRTPGHAGFQLLDLHDYPGQGCAPVGVLDAFWDPKEYVTADEYRRFCNSTVPLARLSHRALTQSESLMIQIEVAHFGPAPLQDAVAVWRVVRSDGAIVASGELPARTIPVGNGTRLGSVEVKSASLAAPRAYSLVVGLKETSFENDWNFWVYPDRVDTRPAKDTLVSSALDDKTLTRLEAGDKVLLLPMPNQLSWDSPPFTFAPVFWNRQLFPKWDRSLGLLCDPRHPALAQFPTAFHSDWQWERVIRPSCRAINIGALPHELTPIVAAIDDWNRNDKLALIFEARVLAGKLLVSSLDLTTGADSSPSKRQLLASLLSYMKSDRFDPTVAIEPEQLEALFFDNEIMAKLGAQVVASAESEGNEARNLVDGDPVTFWMTSREGESMGFPYEISVALDHVKPLKGLITMAQQKDRKRVGEIKDYVVETSVDGNIWRENARGTLEPTFAPQSLLFARTISARQIRLKALSSHDGGSIAALAELAVIVDDKTE